MFKFISFKIFFLRGNILYSQRNDKSKTLVLPVSGLTCSLFLWSTSKYFEHYRYVSDSLLNLGTPKDQWFTWRKINGCHWDYKKELIYVCRTVIDSWTIISVLSRDLTRHLKSLYSVVGFGVPSRPLDSASWFALTE